MSGAINSASRALVRATLQRASTDGETTNLPAWPLLTLLWGYPVFWALGLLPFAQVIMALPMLAFLIVRHRILLVSGILPWVCFVLWMVPSALMVTGAGPLVGLAVRFSQFASVAIMMLYVVNARRTLTPRRVLNALTFIWAFVIVGGYLGMLFPEVRLTLTIGQLLPSAIAGNDYVSDLVFPPLAEIQTPWGASEPFMRPSAPFAYTNGWGAAMAVLTPIAIANALGHRTARAMWLLVFGLLAMVPPAVASTNRGLFIGLAAAAVYVIIRLALRGDWLAFAVSTAISGLGAVILLLSGMLDGIVARQETVDTTAGRGNLYTETFERTFGSPVIGYGAPRPSYVSEIYVGTQGAIWNAMFCFGFVGLTLFAYALLSGALRTVNAPNLSALWIHVSVVVTCLLSVFYGLDRQLVFVCVALALVLRERSIGDSTYWTRTPTPFGRAHEA